MFKITDRVCMKGETRKGTVKEIYPNAAGVLYDDGVYGDQLAYIGFTQLLLIPAGWDAID